MTSNNALQEYRNDFSSLKNHGKSFYWASFFLPASNRLGASQLYSICRYFDDLADESDKNLSEEIKSQLQKITSDKSHEVNVFFQRYGISLSILEDLTNGLIKDQTSVRLNTEAELIEYSYEVAGTVGLMMMPIIDVRDSKAKKHAIDLGIAMQLTNIARDIYEDSIINRIYLPKEWIGEVDTPSLKDIENTQIQNKISDALKRIIKLSNIYYENGFSGLKYIPIRTRLAIYIAAQVYKGIGEKIKSNGFLYDNKRVYLNRFEKLLITLKSIPKFFFINHIYKKYSAIRGTFKNENL